MNIADAISVATLIVGSVDDPVVPLSQYDDLARRSIPNVDLVISGGGGHVGFHDHGRRTALHDRLLLEWLTTLQRPWIPPCDVSFHGR